MKRMESSDQYRLSCYNLSLTICKTKRFLKNTELESKGF